MNPDLFRVFLCLLFADLLEAGAGVIEKQLDLLERRRGEGDQADALVGWALVLYEHASVDGVLHVLHRCAPADVGHQVVQIGLWFGWLFAGQPHLRKQVAVVQIAEAGVSEGFGPETVDGKNRLRGLGAVIVTFAHGYARIP